jgi:hypothetical protein
MVTGANMGTASDLLTVARESTASRQQLWDVIADGWTYSQWVVGNTRMRAVAADWPEPGSTIHHSIGVWPFIINDETVVESFVPGAELVLHAKARPFGGARIVLRLYDTPTGSRIEMLEEPVGGVLKMMPRHVSLALVYPRNRECTARLTALAERRAEPE